MSLSEVIHMEAWKGHNMLACDHEIIRGNALVSRTYDLDEEFEDTKGVIGIRISIVNS